jgi:tetratricopeptide (TPR) repeat protein
VEIKRKYPNPRKGPSCWFVLFAFVVFFGGGYIIARPEPAQKAIQALLPTPTPLPTRSATEYALLADLSVRDGELAEAAGYYQTAIELDASNPEFFIRLIDLLVRTGEAEEALAIAEQVTVLEPNNDRVWTAVSAAHLANGDRIAALGDSTGADLQYAEAVRAADKATLINPENATAYAYKAGGLTFPNNPEQYDRAFEAAETAVLLDPGSAIAHLYMGNIYDYQGYYPAAREQYQLGIQADRTLIDLHINLAYNYFGTGNLPEAILTFREAIDIDPNNAVAYDGLAYMYLQLGELPLARENAIEAIALDPNMARAYGRLGEAYFKEFNYDKSIEELIKATDIYGKATYLNARFFNMLATAYIRKDLALCTEATPLFEEVSAIADPFVAQAALDGLEECRLADR